VNRLKDLKEQKRIERDTTYIGHGEDGRRFAHACFLTLEVSGAHADA
jgi:hypothetical protein